MLTCSAIEEENQIVSLFELLVVQVPGFLCQELAMIRADYNYQEFESGANFYLYLIVILHSCILHV